VGQYGKPEEPTIYVTAQISVKNRKSRIILGITKWGEFYLMARSFTKK